MDDRRFDALARILAGAISRRAAVRTVAGAALALPGAPWAIGGHGGPPVGAARCFARGRRCRRHRQCCSRRCRHGVCAGCPGRRTKCGGACVDTRRDMVHCGGCGRACPLLPCGHACVADCGAPGDPSPECEECLVGDDSCVATCPNACATECSGAPEPVECQACLQACITACAEALAECEAACADPGSPDRACLLSCLVDRCPGSDPSAPVQDCVKGRCCHTTGYFCDADAECCSDRCEEATRTCLAA